MDEEALTFGTALDHFAESEELRSLIDTLPHICQDFTALETSHERFTGVQIWCCLYYMYVCICCDLQ